MVANNNIENKSGADERIYWKAQSDFHQSDSLTFTARKIASIYFTEHQKSVLGTLWKKSATSQTGSINKLSSDIRQKF